MLAGLGAVESRGFEGGDLGDAYEAGRLAWSAGEPAWEIYDVRLVRRARRATDPRDTGLGIPECLRGDFCGL